MTKPRPGSAGCRFPSSVRAPSGKTTVPWFVFQNTNERFQRAAIGSFLIDRNDIEFRQKPTEHRDIEESFAREKINFAAGSNTGERRIEITLDDSSRGSPDLPECAARDGERENEKKAARALSSGKSRPNTNS